MKRLVPFILLVIAVAASAYGLTRYLNARRSEDQWTWLRREFRLSDAQLARIKALHEAYQPICAGHCNRIMGVRQHIAELEKAGDRDSTALLAAREEWDSVKKECNQATLHHLHEVAAVMGADAGRRYLALTVPRLAQFDHREPQGIR